MEKQRFNYGSWTRGRFSEAVTVTGPGKMIFLAGIGAEHEETGEIQHIGDFDGQCRYAYEKLAKVLERNGATLKDVVKQVTYVTYGDNPLPAHTFLVVSQLAWPGMLVEIDVIAMIGDD
jgi:2-iminobutanoate/2-iminopropanoate deaminase